MCFALRNLSPGSLGSIRWVGGFFALFCFAGEASELHASCGDYLHGANGMPIPRHVIVTDIVTTPQPASTQRPAPRPCSGPFCQQAPQDPVDLPRADLSQSYFKDLFVNIDELPCREQDCTRYLPTAQAWPWPVDRHRIERPPQSV